MTKGDDPHDESTQWIGNLPKAGTNNAKHSTERDPRRKDEPDVQRKELPKTEGR